MTSNAIARRDQGAVAHSFGLPARQADLLEQARAQIEPFLPRGTDFQAVIADVFLATRKNPDLLKCEPESLVLAVLEVQARGLRIGTTCHLVPKGGKVCAWNDYRGDLEMVITSGAARDGDAHVVYEHEPFTYAETTSGPELRHEIIADAASRGEIKGAYARFYLGAGRWRIKYMPVADIDKIRQDHSLQWKKGKIPAWYCLKTVIRQGAKLLPKNPRLAKVFAMFAQDEREPDASGAALTVRTLETVDGELADVSTGEILDSGTQDVSNAAPDAEFGKPLPERGTLDWARAFPLPWRQSDQFGKPIGEFSTEHLQSIATWCENRINAAAEQNKPPAASHVDLYDATQLLLEDRENDEPPADETDIPALIDEAPKGAPAGSLRQDMPKPGKIEDAFADVPAGEFPLDDQPKAKRTNRNAQEI